MLNTGTNGIVKSRFIRGANLVAQQINSTSYYYIFNAHGDVLQRVDNAGNRTKRYEYDAFGNQRDFIETDPNPFRYCGEYYDTETNEIYLRARYYNSTNGRFTTEDPAKDGNNWYGYCGGNPNTNSDPSGCISEDQAEKIIIDNANDIIIASIIYDVPPELIAGVIYGEQVQNVNILDSLDGILDTSIGVGQVRWSTAKRMEEEGYVLPVMNNEMGLDILGLGFISGSDRMIRSKRLEKNSTNIMYIAAYLSYQ